MSTTYWYSTDGANHQRLANRHTSLLDQAFDKRKRIQLHDTAMFGNVVAVANPYAGTMTAGNIHYGLYRHPSLWQDPTGISDDLDTLVLIDDDNLLQDASSSNSSTSSTSSRSTSSASSSSSSSGCTFVSPAMSPTNKPYVDDEEDSFNRMLMMLSPPSTSSDTINPTLARATLCHQPDQFRFMQHEQRRRRSLHNHAQDERHCPGCIIS